LITYPRVLRRSTLLAISADAFTSSARQTCISVSTVGDLQSSPSFADRRRHRPDIERGPDCSVRDPRPLVGRRRGGPGSRAARHVLFPAGIYSLLYLPLRWSVIRKLPIDRRIPGAIGGIGLTVLLFIAMVYFVINAKP
jgi:hypothetical protein